MKSNFLKAAAIASVMVFNTAYADNIRVDLSGDNTLTDAFETFQVTYDSHTLVNVPNQTVHTYAGYNLIGQTMGGLAAPTGVFADFGEMTNGLANVFGSAPGFGPMFSEIASSGSFLSFGVDLVGTLGVNGISYTSGTLDLWQGFMNGDAPVKVMQSTFTSGGITVGNQDILSTAGSVDILKEGVMYFDDNGTPVSFTEYFTAHPLEEIRLLIDQNVVGGADQIAKAIFDQDTDAGYKNSDNLGNVYISATHSSTLSFKVPEPTSLAILGLGLLGFAGTRRRKA